MKPDQQPNGEGCEKNIDGVEVDILDPVDDPLFQPLSELLSILSNRTRLAIISIAMKHGEVCACRLQKALGLPQPTITVHLQKLYSSGIFERRESWRYSYYSINKDLESFLRTLLNNEALIQYGGRKLAVSEN